MQASPDEKLSFDTGGGLIAAGSMRVEAPSAGAALVALAERALADGNPRLGLRHLDGVAADDAAFLSAQSLRADAHLRLGEPDKAELALRRAVLAEPDNGGLLVRWAALLTARGDDKGARRALERVLAADAGHADAACALGVAERRRGDLGLALHFLRDAVARAPRHADANRELGITALAAGCDDEATAALRRAVALAPGDAVARASLGAAQLGAGNYEEGLANWHWSPDGTMAGPSPSWHGEAATGQHFRLLADGPAAEALQLVRYAAELKRRGAARVEVLCGDGLAALLAGAPGVDAVIADAEAAGPADQQWPLTRLPAACGTRLDSVPAPDRYLAAPLAATLTAAGQLAERSGLRVGLAWPELPAALAPLATLDGVRLIALMAGTTPFAVERLDDGPVDLVATAAVMENLDLVIATDTAFAHLAGALGRPVWVVVDEGASWVWPRQGDSSPWYPSARLFRRSRHEVETAPFAGLAARLVEALRLLAAGDRRQLCAGHPLPPLPLRPPDQPNGAEALYRLGGQALADDDHHRAVVLFRAAEARGLSTPTFRAAYALALRKAGFPADAERLMRQLVAENPTAEAEIALGALVRDAGRFEEAAEHFRAAIALKPDLARAHRGLGNALRDLNRCDEALAVFATARRLGPADPELLLDEAETLLLKGDYGRGFAGYEVRWRAKEMLPRQFGVPRWQGEDYAGRTLLVHGEQGLDDQIQFSRFLRLAAARGGRMVVEVRPPLVGLMRRIDFGPTPVELVEQGRRLPPHDLEVPLMSLPLVFGTDLDSLPPPLAFPVDGARIDAWRHSLGGPEQLRVGLAWQGGRPDPGRSPPLERLAPLLDLPGLHFVALQPRDGLDQLRASPLAGRLEVVGDRLSDLTEMAAALAAVDLVVGTGGPTTHLAGALGRPTYVMLPANANWRWLVGRDDSPWYPTLRLFRQPRAGDWDSVVAALGGALARLTGGP